MVQTSREAVQFKCVACGEHEHVDVDAAGFRRWQQGELIQRALPDLTPTQREAIKMSWCLLCVDRIYSGLGSDV